MKPISASDRSVAIGGDASHVVAVTGDYSRVFVGDYERLGDAYLHPGQVYERVALEHFTGREWLVRLVDDFLARHDRGYLVLEAEAGLGKSTFLAWLARRRGYVHHFCELAPGAAGIGLSLKSLAAQVVSSCGLGAFEVEDVLPGAAARPDYLRSLLDRAVARRGGPLILVIDALDEGGTPPRQNVLGLPQVLPRGVYVLASQRPVPVTLWADRATTPRDTLTIAAEGDDNARDMRMFLRRVASWPGVARARAAGGVEVDAFVEALAAKCRGVWIYLHYVIHEIDQGVRSPLDLASLPDGMTEYYVRHWRARHDTEPRRWYAAELPLLATLAACREALPLSRLLDWSGAALAPDEARTLLDEDWRPFLLVVGQGGDARYAVYHATLREFFSGQLSHDGLPVAEQGFLGRLNEATRAANCRIADWLLDAWGGLDASLPRLCDDPEDQLIPYGLRNLADHLESAGRVEDLHSLLALEWPLTSPGRPTAAAINAWQCAWDRLGDPLGFQVDVDRAWRLADLASEEARSPATIGLQFRYALLTASLRSTVDKLEPHRFPRFVEAGIWPFERAVAYAHRLPDPLKRAKTFRRLIALAPEHRRPDILAEALTAAALLADPGKRLRLLVGLIPLLTGAARDRCEDLALRAALDRLDGGDEAGFFRAMLALLGALSGTRLQRAIATILARTGRLSKFSLRPRPQRQGRRGKTVEDALADVHDDLERFEEHLRAIGRPPYFSLDALARCLCCQAPTMSEAKFGRLARTVARDHRLWEFLNSSHMWSERFSGKVSEPDRAPTILISLRHLIFEGESVFLRSVFGALDLDVGMAFLSPIYIAIAAIMPKWALGTVFDLIDEYGATMGYPDVMKSHDKSMVIKRLRRYLDPGDAIRVWEIATSLVEPFRTRTMEAVGGLLPAPDCEPYLIRLLEEARLINDEIAVVVALSSLATSREHPGGFEIVEKAWRIFIAGDRDEVRCLDALRSMVELLDEDQRRRAVYAVCRWSVCTGLALKILAPRLSEQLLREAWAESLKWGDPDDDFLGRIRSAEVMLALAPRFTGAARNRRLGLALRAIRAVEPEDDRAVLLTRLAFAHRGPRRSALLREAVETIGRLDDDFGVLQVRYFEKYARRLPDRLRAFALRVADSIADPAHREGARMAILAARESRQSSEVRKQRDVRSTRPGPRADSASLRESARNPVDRIMTAIEEVLASPRGARAEAIGTLANELRATPEAVVMRAWARWLHTASCRTRARVLLGLRATALLAQRLGGAETTDELVRAIEDVTRWLP